MLLLVDVCAPKHDMTCGFISLAVGQQTLGVWPTRYGLCCLHACRLVQVWSSLILSNLSFLRSLKHFMVQKAPLCLQSLIHSPTQQAACSNHCCIMIISPTLCWPKQSYQFISNTCLTAHSIGILCQKHRIRASFQDNVQHAMPFSTEVLQIHHKRQCYITAAAANNTDYSARYNCSTSACSLRSAGLIMLAVIIYCLTVQ